MTVVKHDDAWYRQEAGRLRMELGEPDDDAGDPKGGDQKPPKDSQATKIVRDVVAAADTELWHNQDGDPYLTFRAGQHLEHHQLRSGPARDYLSRLYFRRARTAASSSGIADAQETLSAMARFEGASYPTFVRVAELDGCIYLDLADTDWRVVEIDAIGWRVTSDAPVRFRRPRGLRPLPVPVAGGSIADLARFVNVNTEEDFRLCVMWELAALRGRGPYPILLVTAEQGAAKTTTSRVLRRLCDPNQADSRRPPRNTEDLMIAARNSHILCIDNLSRISDELSDNLSALATGSGFSVRQLYSNDDEHITDVCRPIILNGISQFATRGDVLDRAIALTLPRIADSQRKDERTFWRDFTAAHPILLGAFLDAVSVGLRRVADIHLPRLPRMADFVIWSVAVEPGCPWKEGRFLAGYSRNRMNSVALLLEGDPVAEVVQALAVHGWEGTSSALLTEVNQRTPDDVKRRREWFSLPKQLSDALRRITPALRKVGVTVTRAKGRNTRGRVIRIRRGTRSSTTENKGSTASPPSPPSPVADLLAEARDARDAGDATEHDFSGETFNPAGAFGPRRGDK